MKRKTFDENLASTRDAAHRSPANTPGGLTGGTFNEAHDWANQLGYSAYTVLDLTRASCEGAREGEPKSPDRREQLLRLRRVRRHEQDLLPTGAAAAAHAASVPRACLSAGLDFDVIGLQLYYPGYDLFEIARLLDWYAELGKPLHITELGVSSAPDDDERPCQEGQFRLVRHGPWSEAVQADWVEQFYTLCYSKPAIEAITWWDFADAGHFWPHGEFLRPDFTPKESYRRLKGMIERWGPNERAGPLNRPEKRNLVPVPCHLMRDSDQEARCASFLSRHQSSESSSPPEVFRVSYPPPNSESRLLSSFCSGALIVLRVHKPARGTLAARHRSILSVVSAPNCPLARIRGSTRPSKVLQERKTVPNWTLTTAAWLVESALWRPRLSAARPTGEPV